MNFKKQLPVIFTLLWAISSIVFMTLAYWPNASSSKEKISELYRQINILMMAAALVMSLFTWTNKTDGSTGTVDPRLKTAIIILSLLCFNPLEIVPAHITLILFGISVLGSAMLDHKKYDESSESSDMVYSSSKTLILIVASVFLIIEHWDRDTRLHISWFVCFCVVYGAAFVMQVWSAIKKNTVISMGSIWCLFLYIIDYSRDLGLYPLITYALTVLTLTESVTLNFDKSKKSWTVVSAIPHTSMFFYNDFAYDLYISIIMIFTDDLITNNITVVLFCIFALDMSGKAVPGVWYIIMFAASLVPIIIHLFVDKRLNYIWLGPSIMGAIMTMLVYMKYNDLIGVMWASSPLLISIYAIYISSFKNTETSKPSEGYNLLSESGSHISLGNKVNKKY
jgi:hypothetical protein